MTIRRLIYRLAPDTYVRIRVLCVVEVTGKTGNSGTKNIMKKLRELDCDNAWVTCIRPLHHAEELYIECVILVQ